MQVPYSVIAHHPKTNQIICHQIMAVDGVHAFNLLAQSLENDVTMVVAIKGLLHAGSQRIFPKESLVYSNTLLENLDPVTESGTSPNLFSEELPHKQDNLAEDRNQVQEDLKWLEKAIARVKKPLLTSADRAELYRLTEIQGELVRSYLRIKQVIKSIPDEHRDGLNEIKKERRQNVEAWNQSDDRARLKTLQAKSLLARVSALMLDTSPMGTWTPTNEALPCNKQDVVFIVDCPADINLHGRKLGGRYIAGQGFGVPGLSVNASCWSPFPLGPDEDFSYRKLLDE